MFFIILFIISIKNVLGQINLSKTQIIKINSIYIQDFRKEQLKLQQLLFQVEYWFTFFYEHNSFKEPPF